MNKIYTHDRVLEETRRLSQTLLAPLAQRIDQGYYPLAEMAQLGQAGAFLGHLSEYGGRFDTAILATACVGEACGTTAFLTWCHQACALYLDQSDNAELKRRVLPDHAVARSFGGTALSNPMKSWANIEKLLLRATKTKDGYTVSGTLPWISHIAPDQYCGAVAALDGGGEVFFLLRFDKARKDAWDLTPCPTFLGMEGSSTWRIDLRKYPIGKEDIIAVPCADFVRRVRGAFVLLQMGIAAGIIEGALGDIRAAWASHSHVNAFLEDQEGNLRADLERLLQKTLSLAKTPFETDNDFFLDVLSARAQGAQLTLRATQAALLHQGAKGYALSAAPQRRLREAQFVAIVTPAIKHLRYLSQQLMQAPLPGDDFCI